MSAPAPLTVNTPPEYVVPPCTPTAPTSCAAHGLGNAVDGAGTGNVTPVLATPPAVTTTGPAEAAAGAGATIAVFDQLCGAARKPLNATVPVPCDAPKFEPEIV